MCYDRSYYPLRKNVGGLGVRVAVEIELSAEQRARLERVASSRSSARRLAERSRIVLLAADGLNNQAIATEVGLDQNTVSRWRRRFAESGFEEQAITNVSLDIGRNEVLAMIGPSGCGKSTFLRTLNRMNE